MPATRKSARAAASSKAAAGRGQSTLHFSNRVSKSGKDNSTKDVDSPLPSPPRSSAVLPPKKKAKLIAAEEPEEDSKDLIETAHEVEIETEPEAQAKKITDAQIKRYWREAEASRIAKRVHQEDLALQEKVLRFFDISSQYGPCIGISRTKRWYRANRLGLEPPIEVLAILLKEDSKAMDMERSAMDRLMESTAIGSV